MSEERLSNSAEHLFWNSNYSRIMNFHDSLKNRAAKDLPRNPEASLHPDVYFHLNFVPFVNRNASA